ncbi:hypothetical protein FEK47_23480 [Escherichia sp. E3659]|uniref:hypothetical protein n=1 Tax=unclassified Escherichia TaxID=2608889 RepID=UPI00108106BA|nr:MULTISPECIES: hypothetical protein [unclassified Escherichia]TGB80760.1 hypothetical protein CRI67_00100 [Escherichia sp. E4702]TGB81585.1 hypothetical protein CRI65_24460 [Escherichia sp. E3659]TLJ03288.1 hypothetical protein FEK47_23480 [Escherichia sp. E3659]
MTRTYFLSIIFLAIFTTNISYADIEIKSPEGGRLIFSQEKKGEHYDNNSWGKIVFSRNAYSADLSRSDRYYIENGSSKPSPSGKYLIVTSVSGGYVEFGDGEKKYTDKAYCSVVDMTNGCIVSDWDGEACGYSWVGNKDVLASSGDVNADKFDFQSMRPMINKTIDDFSGIDEREVANMLRCDSPSKENINAYQRMAKENKKMKRVVLEYISGYLSGITEKSTVKTKSNLFSLPNDNSKTSAYLVPGDKVRIIQISPDNEWVNIGYINKKGSPLISWVKAEMLEQ